MKITKPRIGVVAVIGLLALMLSTTGSFSTSYVEPEYCESETGPGFIVNGSRAGFQTTCVTTSCYSLLTDMMTFQETCCDGIGCSVNFG